MPPGTAPGLSGATPPGRVLFFLDPAGLVGANAFEFGQHLDLVASRTTGQASGRNRGGFSNVALSEAQRTRVESVAEDVVVVMPVHSPANPTLTKTSAGDKLGAGQLIIAVRPDQVAQLEYAVAIGSGLRATVRSGISAEVEQEVSSASQNRVKMMKFDPLSEAKRTEIFIGGSHQSHLFGTNQ